MKAFRSGMKFCIFSFRAVEQTEFISTGTSDLATEIKCKISSVSLGFERVLTYFFFNNYCINIFEWANVFWILGRMFDVFI